MKELIRFRHILAPAIGALLILVAFLLLNLPLTTSLLVGGISWVATALFLSPVNPFARLHKQGDLAFDPRMMESELTNAQNRIQTLRDSAKNITDYHIRRSLLQIADAAEAIVEEVLRDPMDYPKVRKALVHSLGHAVAIGTGLESMQRTGGRTDVETKARTALPKLFDAFERYRNLMSDNEAFDIDTRLAVLERELDQFNPPPADNEGLKP